MGGHSLFYEGGLKASQVETTTLKGVLFSIPEGPGLTLRKKRQTQEGIAIGPKYAYLTVS